MTIRLQNVRIDDPRRPPRETVQRLRLLLSAGAEAQAESGRQDFYELNSGTEVFYFHISPVTRRVLLLAVWDRPSATVPAHPARLAAHPA